jgi:5-methylcytosine-specific restriction endonuclease McrA
MKKTCSTEGCARPVLARTVCAPHYSTWHRAQRKYTITCAHCGITAQVQQRKYIYCSQKCSAAAGSYANREKTWPLSRRLPVIYVGTKQPLPEPVEPSRRRLTSGSCRVCSRWFVSIRPHVTCSDPCYVEYRMQVRRRSRHRRRARQTSAYVSDVWRSRIFERDNYRCHICRRKTLPKQVVPHPRAPTIDHLVPLAQGGKHEPINCRTACFMCNCTKRDQGGGEQLLLIA